MIKSIKLITASSFLAMFFMGVGSAIIGAASRDIGLTAAQIGLLIAAVLLWLETLASRKTRAPAMTADNPEPVRRPFFILALLGGTPVRTKLFPAYSVIGEDDRAAVAKVMESGILSRFLGTWHNDFFGGPEVKAFEHEWATAFQAAHAVSVNSATSAAGSGKRSLLQRHAIS